MRTIDDALARDLLLQAEECVTNEKIDGPKHYGGAESPYEAIKVIEAWDLGFALGNAVKYVSRAGRKPGESALDDLRKARWYLEREIKRLEREAPAPAPAPAPIGEPNERTRAYGITAGSIWETADGRSRLHVTGFDADGRSRLHVTGFDADGDPVTGEAGAWFPHDLVSGRERV